MYSINVYDRVGEYSTENVDSFDACLVRVGELARQYPAKVVRAFNLDGLDVDSNGLTDEENEAVWDAVNAALGVA